jgi:P2 family phage contractile tail tube protein
MIPSIFKNMSMSLEGVGYLGKSEELTPPKLALKTEEHRGGGMDAPIDIEMGMEGLTSEWSMAGLEEGMIAQFGSRTDRLVFRGAYVDQDGNTKSVKIQQSGLVKEADMGSWKAGEKAVNKFTASLTYYELVIDGKQICEIDIPNMKRVINGVDQLAEQRAALGE